MSAAIRSVAPKALTVAVQPAGIKGKVFTTVDGGRLHIAFENRYAGSVSSYNNWLTQSVAGLFGWSEQVSINGKVRYVEKEDYIKFLNENMAHTEARVDTIKEYVDFHALRAAPAQDRGMMRHNISQQKSQRLFEKLVSAMVEKSDYEKARKLVAKGAELDHHFWVRSEHGVSFTNLTAGLPQKKALSFQAGHYTPLLYAAAVNKKNFTEYLSYFEPALEAHGETVKFERKIVGVTPGQTVVTTEDVGSKSGHVLTRQTVKTSTTIDMQDIRTPMYIIHFNPEDHSLVWMENKDRGVIENYDHSVVRYSTKVTKK